MRSIRSSSNRPPAIADHVDVIATQHGINPLLVAAIIEVESAGNPWAMRFEPTWPYYIDEHVRGVSEDTELMQQSTSWGLMQVMGTTARELGCDAPFLSALCEPKVGIEFGCRYLARQLERYDGNEVAAVAAYNAGTARESEDGGWVNQSYVNKVWSAYGRLRGDV